LHDLAGSSVGALRELREADADDVVRLYRQVFGDQRPLDATEVVSWLRNPELREGWLRVLEVGGQVAGYGDINVLGDVLAVDVAAPGSEDVFLDWAEEEARIRRVGRVRVHFPAGHELARVLEARGYHYWRSAYTMQVELGDEPPDARAVPPGLQVRPYADREVETLRAALNEAFAADPFHTELTRGTFREFYLRQRGFDPALWQLAWEGDELAGFVLAFPERHGDESLGSIDTLGVKAQWRRRGLGEALLRRAFGLLHARGLRKIALGVDAENPGALRLYERVGMHVVRQGDNWVLDV
jgi:mycothiol synthase